MIGIIFSLLMCCPQPAAYTRVADSEITGLARPHSVVQGNHSVAAPTHWPGRTDGCATIPAAVARGHPTLDFGPWTLDFCCWCWPCHGYASGDDATACSVGVGGGSGRRPRM